MERLDLGSLGFFYRTAEPVLRPLLGPTCSGKPCSGACQQGGPWREATTWPPVPSQRRCTVDPTHQLGRHGLFVVRCNESTAALQARDGEWLEVIRLPPSVGARSASDPKWGSVSTASQDGTCWFWTARGSGVFLNVGRSLRVNTPADVTRALSSQSLLSVSHEPGPLMTTLGRRLATRTTRATRTHKDVRRTEHVGGRPPAVSRSSSGKRREGQQRQHAYISRQREGADHGGRSRQPHRSKHDQMLHSAQRPAPTGRAPTRTHRAGAYKTYDHAGPHEEGRHHQGKHHAEVGGDGQLAGVLRKTSSFRESPSIAETEKSDEGSVGRGASWCALARMRGYDTIQIGWTRHGSREGPRRLGVDPPSNI